jgi:hypothetical protein|tara:strand:+ start:10851 stop:11177 length:327 start_codon:yes stop_codon:yes gene_type:complete
MAVTIDPRPTVFGDRMIVTGTYAAGDNAIDLTGMLASIDFAGANSSGAIAARPITDTGGTANLQNVVFGVDVRIDGTTVRLAAGLADGTIGDTAPAQAGTFIAIGRRS